MPNVSVREAAVREVATAATTYQGDPDRFLPPHTPDVEIVNFGGRRVLGREALGEAMRAALASPMADVTTVEIAGVRFPREGVAVVAAVKHVRDARDGAAEEWRISPAQTAPTTFWAPRSRWAPGVLAHSGSVLYAEGTK